MTEKSFDCGKRDAERFIRDEQIDYEPFVAISDLYLVRNARAVSYESFKDSVEKCDADLWSAIDESVKRLAQENKKGVNPDEYAEGFAEGVAAVWEKIRPEILKR